MTAIERVADWLFRDRSTGRIVVAQFPNIPLFVWLGATVASLVTSGRVQTVMGHLATLALIVWAGDEIIRGVNPFRRMLGAVVLGVVVLSLLRR